MKRIFLYFSRYWLVSPQRVLIIRAPSVFKFIWGLCKHFFDPELRAFFIFASGEADSQQLLEKYIDPDVLPHCIHPGGKDGRVARGYEHVIMEGGPLPPEGTYSTPQYCKEGKTKAEYLAYLQQAGDLELGAARQLSDQTKDIAPQMSGVRCRTLMEGHFNSGFDDNFRIQVTSSNHHLVGLN